MAIQSYRIYRTPTSELKDKFGLVITDDDRDYRWADFSNFPMFIGASMTLFEGNGQILNIYSETTEPNMFPKLLFVMTILLAIVVGMGVGILGYLAFGKTI